MKHSGPGTTLAGPQGGAPWQQRLRRTTRPCSRRSGWPARSAASWRCEDYAIRIERGDLIGLIGPNGAGKTTVFNLLSGVLRPDAGRIYWRGIEVTDRPTHEIARRGLARTFQNIRLFPDLSVIENVMAGLHMRHGAGLLATLLALPRFGRAEAAIRRRAEATLELAGLQALAAVRAGDLAYGDQRRVEIARALATEPQVLLLDEPAAGMNPSETQTVVR